MPRRRSSRSPKRELSIPQKANRILLLTLIAMGCIAVRLFQLTIMEHEAALERSMRPQVRHVVERAERGTIRDRFNEPLAMNAVRYNAAVLYAQIKEIPSVRWLEQEDGTKKKIYVRREYITELSERLSQVLDMEPDRIEDLIYSKAALFHQVPYVLQQDISEEQYYRLRALEREWPGIQAERVAKRIYPKRKVASDLVGYMGAISGEEYREVMNEIRELKEYLQQVLEDPELMPPDGLEGPRAARERLVELEERAYTYNDFVGKAGIEAVFEEELRGYYGRRSFAADAAGNFLHELPDARAPVPGKRVLLSISSELQRRAEELLIASEQIRDGRSLGKDPVSGGKIPLKQPWIKGGAIVAMDPSNGEILALATYPRFDPNDFIPSGDPETNREKQEHIKQWLELDSYVGAIWDGHRPIVRESVHPREQLVEEEELWLDWEVYLDHLLSRGSPIKSVMQRIGTIRQAARLLDATETLRAYLELPDMADLIDVLFYTVPHDLYGSYMDVETRAEKSATLSGLAPALRDLRVFVEQTLGVLEKNAHKLIVLDLCRLVIDPASMDRSVLEKVGSQTLAKHRQSTRARNVVMQRLQREMKLIYRQVHFKDWRENYGKAYLRSKRLEEDLAGRYQKPFLDYFDAVEKKLFAHFWETHQWQMLALYLDPSLPQPELSHEKMQPYRERLLDLAEESLADPRANTLRDQLALLGSDQFEAYLSSMRTYAELDDPLYGRYSYLGNRSQCQQLKDLARGFDNPQGNGYCRSYAYRHHAVQGSVFKVVVAYEAIAQRYKKLKEQARPILDLNPLTIIDRWYRPPGSKQWIVATTMDGQPIPQIYKGGRLLRTLSRNVGETDLFTALERSSNPYFALLATDVLDDPEDVNHAALELGYGEKTGVALPGELAGSLPDDIVEDRSGLYAYTAGQHSLLVTPLQTAVALSTIANGGDVVVPKIVRLTAGRELGETQQRTSVEEIPAEVRRQAFMPSEVRSMLLSGLEKVVKRHQSVGRMHLLNVYRSQPGLARDYFQVPRLVGKSSTAESVELTSLDRQQGGQIYNHTWFAGIGFEPPAAPYSGDAFGTPEIVVVVYLRYGGLGSEAAPIAGQIVKQWREIKSRS